MPVGSSQATRILPSLPLLGKLDDFAVAIDPDRIGERLALEPAALLRGVGRQRFATQVLAEKTPEPGIFAAQTPDRGAGDAAVGCLPHQVEIGRSIREKDLMIGFVLVLVAEGQIGRARVHAHLRADPASELERLDKGQGLAAFARGPIVTIGRDAADDLGRRYLAFACRAARTCSMPTVGMPLDRWRSWRSVLVVLHHVTR